VELLILYACVQFYTPRASDYRLNSKTVFTVSLPTLYFYAFEFDLCRIFIRQGWYNIQYLFINIIITKFNGT
jgi:hypothetical protein